MEKTVEKIFLPPLLTDEQTADLAGKKLQQSDCRILITRDADVYCESTGQCLAKFRKRRIPGFAQKAAYDNLKAAAVEGDNRGVAAGFDEKLALQHARKEGARGIVRSGKHKYFIVKKDGTLSKTERAVPTKSGIVGYFDRSSRFPYCRLTAFTYDNFDKFKKAYPLIKCVDEAYKELMPKEYALQQEMCNQTVSDFVIPGTVFTTVTVNKNFPTAVHKDAGDFKKGFGNLTVLKVGRFTGGNTVFPKWGVGFDVDNGDILMMNVHEWHGNTPIVMKDRNAVRLSFVMYYREKMHQCGTLHQELERAKRNNRRMNN